MIKHGIPLATLIYYSGCMDSTSAKRWNLGKICVCKYEVFPRQFCKYRKTIINSGLNRYADNWVGDSSLIVRSFPIHYIAHEAELAWSQCTIRGRGGLLSGMINRNDAVVDRSVLPREALARIRHSSKRVFTAACVAHCMQGSNTRIAPASMRYTCISHTTFTKVEVLSIMSRQSLSVYRNRDERLSVSDYRDEIEPLWSMPSFTIMYSSA